MLSARWAHRALVGFCILLVVGVMIYLAYLGWLGALLHEWALWLFEPISKRLQHAEHLERFARLAGAVGTLLTAAVGVYKGIYYADRNLPERLKQLLNRDDARLRADRSFLLQAASGFEPTGRAHRSLFYDESLNRSLDKLGFPNVEPADEELKKAVEDIDKRIEVAACQFRHLHEQKVTAHLLRGSIAAAKAQKFACTGKLPDDQLEAAENEFSAAINLRPSDLDARELRGKQRLLRGAYAGAEEDFSVLVSAAQSVNDFLRAARGKRLLAELKQRITTRTNLQLARALYREGIAILNRKGTLLDVDHGEKGLLHLGCARTQISLDSIRMAKTNLEAAIRSFELAPTADVANHLVEAKRLLKTLQPPGSQGDGRKESEKRSWLRRLLAG